MGRLGRLKQMGYIDQSAVNYKFSTNDMLTKDTVDVMVRNNKGMRVIKADMERIVSSRDTGLYKYLPMEQDIKKMWVDGWLMSMCYGCRERGNGGKKTAYDRRADYMFSRALDDIIGKVAALGISIDLVEMSKHIVSFSPMFRKMCSDAPSIFTNTTKILHREVSRLNDERMKVAKGQLPVVASQAPYGMYRWKELGCNPEKIGDEEALPNERAVGSVLMTAPIVLYGNLLNEMPVFAVNFTEMLNVMAFCIASVYGIVGSDIGAERHDKSNMEPNEAFELWLHEYASIRGETWRDDLRELVQNIKRIPKSSEEAVGHYDIGLIDYYEKECKLAKERILKKLPSMHANEDGSFREGDFTLPLAQRIHVRTNGRYDNYLEVGCIDQMTFYGGSGAIKTDYSENMVGPWIRLHGLATATFVEVNAEEKEEIAKAIDLGLRREIAELQESIDHRNGDIVKSIEELSRKYDRSVKDLGRSEGAVNEMKRRLKSEKADRKVLEDRIKELSKQAQTGVKDLELLDKLKESTDRLNRASDDAEKAKRSAYEADRKCERAIKEKEAALEEKKQLAAELKSCQERLVEAGEVIHQLRLEEGMASVPIECYIQSLSGRKVLFIGGGAYAVGKLKAYLPKAKVLTRDEIGKVKDMQDYELVILAQKENDHSVMRRVEAACKNVVIKVVSVHSPEALIIEAFKALYG